ncbi:MAG: amidase, partial [Gemmataceae bacterium]
MIEKKKSIGRICETAQSIRDGTVTCRRIVEKLLFRIAQMDKDARSWVWVATERVLKEASKLDELLKRGIDLGPLHGIPVGIKDIIDVHDWPTACGSKLWEKSFARMDAPVVQRLRQAGAIILGKTVTTAYASFDPPETKNPWNPLRTPGGSSSGSAAAVANSMCLASLGTQTGGSIIRPAAYCGISACKPSYGFTSLEGVLPLAKSMDHIGPMAHSVEDLRILMGAIAEKGSSRLTGGIKSNRKRKKETPVLGIPEGFFEKRASPEILQTFSETVAGLETEGACLTLIHS